MYTHLNAPALLVCVYITIRNSDTLHLDLEACYIHLYLLFLPVSLYLSTKLRIKAGYLLNKNLETFLKFCSLRVKYSTISVNYVIYTGIIRGVFYLFIRNVLPHQTRQNWFLSAIYTCSELLLCLHVVAGCCSKPSLQSRVSLETLMCVKFGWWSLIYSIISFSFFFASVMVDRIMPK